jgi:hypothetical protein
MKLRKKTKKRLWVIFDRIIAGLVTSTITLLILQYLQNHPHH